MSAAPDKEGDGHAKIAIPEDHHEHHNEKDEPTSPGGMKNSKGWDGKLRVPKSAVLANPEALTDEEYSDDENVMEGEEIAADEGECFFLSPSPSIY